MNNIKETNAFMVKAGICLNVVQTLVLIVIQIFKGDAIISTLLGVIIFCTLPIIGLLRAYKRNNESQNLRYISFIPFFLTYIYFMLFSASRDISFVFIFPVMMIYFVYYDTRLTDNANLITFVINLGFIIFDVFSNLYRWHEVIYGQMMRVCLLFTFGIVISSLSKWTIRVHITHLEELEAKRKEQDIIFERLISMSNTMLNDANNIEDIVVKVIEASSSVNYSVEQIAVGATENTTTIQNQSEMTKDIQTDLQGTLEEFSIMKDAFEASKKEIIKGSIAIENLNNKAMTADAIYLNTSKAVGDLQLKSKEIHYITEMIKSIADQTNLLSLNAAIESARAGEAGKGFAVVAEEIRKLASQSKDFTHNISQILKELEQDTGHTAEYMKQLTGVNEEQNKSIKETKEAFMNIATGVEIVNDKIRCIDTRIGGITELNSNIVASIDDLSAVSQETAASTEEVSSLSLQNVSLANEAKSYVKNFIELAKEIKAHFKA